MELRYKREVAVGAMLVMGTLAFIALMMWLRGKSFRRSVIVPVTFSDVMGLKPGDPVRTSGVRVGAVKRIELVSPGNVTVYLDVHDGPPPKEDAKVRILSQDLFGARFIDYNPGVAERALPADTLLHGGRAQDMGEMAEALGARTTRLLDSANAMTVMVSRELRVTLRNAQTLLGTLNTGAGTSTRELVGVLENLRGAIQRVDLLVQQNGPGATRMIGNMASTSARADTVMRNLQRTSAQVDSVLAKINSGRGPAAAMLNDSTVVQNLMQTNAALRDLLTDFRANPGRYIRLRLF